MNGDACKWNGQSYSPSAAREACETTKKYCSGGRSVGGPMVRSVGPVNLAQCANVRAGRERERERERGREGGRAPVPVVLPARRFSPPRCWGCRNAVVALMRCLCSACALACCCYIS